jgi:transcriptional regulator with GAF, ATPase, and Fis domain
VLGVISSSPGELEPVFRTILENATRICEAKFGILWLYDAETFQVGALRDVPEEVASRGPVRPGPLHPLARLVATRQIVHISDYAEDAAYKQRDPLTVKLIELAGARTLIEVPMLKEGELIAAIAIYRQEVRPFTEKQIALVQNFAAQAVIAIENARLLNELRQRTADLSESLEQQTATADVLRVISGSPAGLEPVFSAIMENALRICEAKFGMLMRYSDGAFVTHAMVGAPPALVDALLHKPLRPPPGNPLGRMLRTKQLIHSVDAASEEGKPLYCCANAQR